MSIEAKAIDDISDLRKQLSGIPRVRLEFAKAIIELLATHHISVSGDLLGRLTIATCDEIKGEDGTTVAVWTN